MKIHAKEIFLRNLQFILFLGTFVFCIIATSSNFWMILTAKKPLIIGIDENGSRIIDSKDDPIFKTEAANFIKSFLSNLYNFNSQSFLRQIGAATNLMSEELWTSKKSSILDLRKKVAVDDIEIHGQIEKITIDESGTYHGLITLKEKNRVSEKVHKLHVKLSIQATKRTHENPYGMEISSYEEIRLNN